MSGDESIVEPTFDAELAALLRAGAPQLDTTPGTPALFQAIRGELGLGDASIDLTDRDGVTGEVAAGSTTSDDDGEVASVIDLSSRRRFGGPIALTALVAGILLLVGLPLVLAVRGNDPVELASGDLADLVESQTSSSTASLLDDDGDIKLDVLTTLATDAGDDEFLELWLLDVDDEGNLVDLVSLGELNGSGRYDVPDDLDLGRFDIVDVSAEPDDGDPTHSGVSLVRGELTA